MTDPHDATLREIVTRLQVVVETLDKTVTRLVDKTVSLEAHQALERRVSGLEGAMTWAVRLIIGVVIIALLGVVITQGGGPG
jgi:hypothetical protein